MAMVKFTMIFQVTTAPIGGAASQRTGGWTESVYQGVFNQTTQAFFRDLCRARASLLPVQAAIVGQRYQNVDPTGGSSTGAERFTGTVADDDSSHPATDIPQMALLCRSRTDALNIRPTILRCFPDYYVRGGELNRTSGLTQRLNAYFAQLNNWKMRGRDLATPAFAIVEIAADGTVQLEAAHSFTIPSMVTVRSAIDSNGLRQGGRFKILSQATSSSVTLLGWSAGLCEGGTLRAPTITYPQVVATDVSRIVVRKVGRAPFQYRGRQSKRR